MQFTPRAPVDWRPLTVLDPRTSQYFTDAGAWDFSVELIVNGHPIRAVTLVAPPGKTGYELLVPGCAGRPPIYIKLQIGSGVVFGRSFHESYRL